jgi:hypothetical protein
MIMMESNHANGASAQMDSAADVISTTTPVWEFLVHTFSKRNDLVAQSGSTAAAADHDSLVGDFENTTLAQVNTALCFDWNSIRGSRVSSSTTMDTDNGVIQSVVYDAQELDVAFNHVRPSTEWKSAFQELFQHCKGTRGAVRKLFKQLAQVPILVPILLRPNV